MDRSSLRASLAIAALLSINGGIIGHGIYFLAREVYHFDDQKNLALAFAIFLPYVPAALLAGPLASRIGSRRLLALVNTVLIVFGIMLAFEPPEWAFWLLAAGSNAGAGMLWPLIEAGVSRGRSGAELRRAVGAFNLSWAATLSIGLAVVALAEGELRLVFGVLVGLHLLIFPLIPGVGGVHAEAAPEPVPADWRPLLAAARVLMPMAYLLLDCMAPLLPGVWAALGVSVDRAPLYTATWMLIRVVIFAGMSRWGGWQGSPLLLGIGTLSLLAGCGLVLAAPGVVPVLAGLVFFGAGHAMIYYAALFYGMAVGGGEVEAGGKHEAVIGLGYLGGPVLALGGFWLGTGPLPVLAVVVALILGVAWRRVQA